MDGIELLPHWLGETLALELLLLTDSIEGLSKKFHVAAVLF
jgi:hypothetical protein